MRTCRITVLVLALGCALSAVSRGDDWERAFVTPPDTAKPWAYWWWLNGHVSREGITQDLEEMKRQGINGVLIFNAGGGETPPGLKFMGPEWKVVYKHALNEATRLGMEVSVNLCDGWDAGGPWIQPESANKQLVCSETQADGPGRMARPLPQPFTRDGYYRDVAVLAFPEKSGSPLAPQRVSASGEIGGYCDEKNWPCADVADRDPETTWRAGPPGAAGGRWLRLDYTEPLEAIAVYVATPAPDANVQCRLQASDDGQQFRNVSEFPFAASSQRITFPRTAARFFRLRFIEAAQAGGIEVSELWLLRAGDEPQLRPGTKWWHFKSANRSFWDWPKQGPAVLREDYPGPDLRDLRGAEVVDLTGRLRPDGTVDWDVPAGRWTVLRCGYTLQGQRTRAGSTVGGYEADMLSAAGIECHFRNLAEPLLQEAGDAVGRTLKFLHVDSYELGADVQGQQPTWSADFRQQFQRRRGYDLLPYLPAMARRVVDGREVTDRFFWDFRQTIGDLMAEEFFGRFAALAHGRGVGIHAETGYGTYPHPHFDGLRCAGACDITMGEFWHGTDIMSQFDPFCNVIRSVASAAHIYGRRIVQAEAFTSWDHFLEHPYGLKALGDEAFCDGLNRMVFHQYTHQPRSDVVPGWQYGAGTHIDRHLTWWPMAGAWFTYLARCQSLLQAGRFHADLCYFYGEGATRYVPGRTHVRPALPIGYDFDCVNAHILYARMTVQNGRLLLPDGQGYRVLVLPEQERTMSPAVLRRIGELLGAGATVVGPRPLRAPGLNEYPKCDEELRTIADGLWGEGTADQGDRQVGRGRLIWGRPLAEVLAKVGLSPDFEPLQPGPGTKLNFIHRAIDRAEVYFVSNARQEVERVDCAFRLAGFQSELWDPVSGKIQRLAEARVESGRTIVPMVFAPSQSFFVVFRPVQPGLEARFPSISPIYPDLKQVSELTGPWEVSFDPKWGGPRSIEFRTLEDWTSRVEPGVRYYSGTATYRQTFDLPLSGGGGAVPERRYLDLGKVHNVARVRLNGRDLGVVWCAPWRIEIPAAVRASGNRLEIDVANLWPNRLIGDAGLPSGERFARTNVRYGKDHPLLPSGLLGPVTIQSERSAGR